MNLEYEGVFFVSWLIRIIIFQQISNFRIKRLYFFLIPVVFTLIEYFYYDVVFWGEIFFLPFLAFFIKIRENWSWSRYLFYCFFSLTFYDILGSIASIYFQFIFRLSREYIDDNVWLDWFPILLSFPLYYSFLKISRINLESLSKGIQNRKILSVVVHFTSTLVVYYICSYILASFPVFEHLGWIQYGLDDIFYKRALLFTYIPVFLGFFFYINYLVGKQSEEELQKIKDEQIESLSKYSTHMEALYKEIRSFRHDYTNLLSSLNYAIQNRDIDGVEEIYSSVFKNSDEQFKSSRYDIANLSNIDNESLKSVISLKMIEAQHKGINLSVEVENHISAPDPIELIDLLKVVSIFLDNALEAAVQAEEPSLSFAYFETNSSKVMIIENSTKEKKLNTKVIYNYGHSSKGTERGVGLANVKEIIQTNPNLSLQTSSNDYIFRQELIFNSI